MKSPWSALGPTGRVRFARLRAIIWAVIGVVSIPTGWMSSVVAVWMASVYANVESGIAAAEAADDEAILAEVRALRRVVDHQGQLIAAMLTVVGTLVPPGEAVVDDEPDDDEGDQPDTLGAGQPPDPR